MRHPFDYFGAAFVLVLAAFLAGCGTSAPTRFYTLSAAIPGDVAPAARAPGASRTVVGVGAVEIPDYLDRPQVVTRASQNRLVISECDLWGGSLKADVNRVLLENLTRVLPPDRFSVVAMKRGVPVDCRVTVGIVRFEVTADEGAVLHAQWVLSGRDGKGNASFGSARLVEPVATGDIQGAVVAMSRVLGRLSGEMAAHIRATAE